MWGPLQVLELVGPQFRDGCLSKRLMELSWGFPISNPYQPEALAGSGAQDVEIVMKTLKNAASFNFI